MPQRRHWGWRVAPSLRCLSQIQQPTRWIPISPDPEQALQLITQDRKGPSE